MSEPQADLRLFYAHMARLLNTDDGQMLLEWLEARYVARRGVVQEDTLAGTMQRVARKSLAGSTPYETYQRIGQMDVVNLLKDLQEWQE